MNLFNVNTNFITNVCMQNSIYWNVMCAFCMFESITKSVSICNTEQTFDERQINRLLHWNLTLCQSKNESYRLNSRKSFTFFTILFLANLFFSNSKKTKTEKNTHRRFVTLYLFTFWMPYLILIHDLIPHLSNTQSIYNSAYCWLWRIWHIISLVS